MRLYLTRKNTRKVKYEEYFKTKSAQISLFPSFISYLGSYMNRDLIFYTDSGILCKNL